MPILPPPQEGEPGLGVGPQYVQEQGQAEGPQDVPTLTPEQVAQILAQYGLLGGGGGGGGGGFGSGGAPPEDPTVTAAKQFYFQLWGRKPPERYVERFIDQGHDLYDFVVWQLSRPPARQQQFYRDQFARYASIAASVFGRR